MSTFPGTYGPTAMMAAVGEHVHSIEMVNSDMAIHTVTLILNGQHGEFDLVVEATDMESMEEHRWEGVAHRTGGVADFKEVEVR